MSEAVFPVVARIRSDFDEKFGIPRQSGLVEELRSEIVFEPEYRNADYLRGIEDFSHLWLLWQFSANRPGTPSPTVRPPRLGGNRRMGVFATRSPYRPSPIGLSCVRLLEVKPRTDEGPVLVVGGADLLNGTPILDIKPYLPYADCRPEASGGFTDRVKKRQVQVDCPEALLALLPEEKRMPLLRVLREDPRPAYQEDGERLYSFLFAGHTVRFVVRDGVLAVKSIEKETL